MNPDSNPQPTVPAQPERAPKGCCEYIIRVDGKQQECGAPGAYKGRTRPFLTYCKMHGEFLGARSFEVVALDGSGRSIKPFRFENRRNANSL